MKYTLTMYQHKAESPANEPDDNSRKPDEYRYGDISADHLDGDKITYIEQACENHGNLVITCNGRRYPAKMVTQHRYKKWKGVIFLGMSMSDALQLKCLNSQFSIKVKVDFELKYSYFDHLHRAVDLLSFSTLQRLFPSANCFSATIPEENQLFLSKKYQEYLSLDYGQIRALKMTVFAEPKAPVIVAGSFGTGKTRMLAQAAFQIFIAQHDQQPRVLVCAHHQASANSFLINCFIPMKEKEGWRANVVRMMPRNRIKQMNKEYQPYCSTAYQVANRLHTIGLVVSTFGTTLQLAEELIKRNGTLDGKTWFTHILIDEGAQTREPETITPLSLCGENTVIAIAGDHKQVSLF